MIQFDEHIFQMAWFSHQLEKHLQHFVKNREAKKPSISAALNSASMAGSEAGFPLKRRDYIFNSHRIHGTGIFTYMNGEKWPHEHGEM